MATSADRQRLAREHLARAAAAEDGIAIALLTEAIELDPALHEAYVALGRIYRRLGQLRAELAMWNERARIGGVDGDVAERIDELRLRNKDEGPMPRYDLAAVHALRGEHDQARRWLADAIAAGWRYPDLARRDPLLADLPADPAFIAMVAAPI